MSNVVLGSAPGATNVVHVSPGATIAVALDYTLNDCGCKTCIDQIEVGLVPGDPQVCPFSGTGHCMPQAKGSSMGMTITAPTTPGTYDFRFNMRQDYGCLVSSTTWWGATPPASQTVGTVCVQ